MEQNCVVKAKYEYPKEVDPFQLDEDSDYPLSSDESDSVTENIEEEITRKKTKGATSKRNHFLARLCASIPTIQNVLNESEEDEMPSVIPEQYAPRKKRLSKKNRRERMLASSPEPFRLLNADDSVLTQLPTHNGRLNSGPLIHIPMGIPTEPSWDEEYTEIYIADAEVTIKEDEHKLATPLHCAFNHALCLNYHDRPWLYSDEDDSENNTTSDLSDTDNKDSTASDVDSDNKDSTASDVDSDNKDLTASDVDSDSDKTALFVFSDSYSDD